MLRRSRITDIIRRGAMVMTRFSIPRWLVVSLVVLLCVFCVVMVLAKVSSSDEIVAKVFEAPKGSKLTALHLSPDGRKIWALFVSISRTADSSDVLFSIVQPAIALDAFSHEIVSKANVNESNPWSSLLALSYGDPSVSSVAEQFQDWVIDKDRMVIYGCVSSQAWYEVAPPDTVIRAIEIKSRKQLWERKIPKVSALALSPDGRQLWVASDQRMPATNIIESLDPVLAKIYDEARVVYVIEPQDGTILKRIGYIYGLGVDRIVFSPDGKRAICVSRGGPAGLLVIDAQRLEIEEGWCEIRFSMFSRGMDACFDPDGRHLYVLDRGFDEPPSVQVYDLIKKTEIDTISLTTAGPARSMVLSKPADKLFIGADDGIYVVNLSNWRK